MKSIASSIWRRASSNRGAALAVLLCAACGAESSGPLNISGQVVLGQDANGAPQVRVSAAVTRSLPDGATEVVTDADLALNGVPLGPMEPGLLRTPGFFTWAVPSFPGAVPLGHQALSVIGSNASVSFDCPPAISFLEPVDGASIDRNLPLSLAWTPGGSTTPSPLLVTSWGKLEGNTRFETVGTQSVEPGATAAQVPVPADLPAGGDLFLALDVYGDGSDYTSSCAAEPRLHLIVP